MMMKSTQMITRTTSIWRSLKKCRKRPLISKKMKRKMMRSKVATMMTSSRRALGQKLEVREASLEEIVNKRMELLAKMAMVMV